MVAAKETTTSSDASKERVDIAIAVPVVKKGSITTTWELSPDADDFFHKEFEKYKAKHPDRQVPFGEYIETVILTALRTAVHNDDGIL